MSNKKTNRLGFVAAAFLAFALGASPAIATEILEIELGPDDNGSPQYMVIWGTGFGDTVITPQSGVGGKPVIFIGTESDPLVIPADQGACLDPPPQPLENFTDCVVAEMPITTIPAGDYRVRLGEDSNNGSLPLCDCENSGKPSQLTFNYSGDNCAASNNLQENDFTCSGDLDGDPQVQVECNGGSCSVDPADQ